MPKIRDDDVIFVRGNTAVNGKVFVSDERSARVALEILKRAPDQGQHPFISSLINLLSSPAVPAAQVVDQPAGESVVEHLEYGKVVDRADVRDERIVERLAAAEREKVAGRDPRLDPDPKPAA